MTSPQTHLRDDALRKAIEVLDSLVGGERAAEQLAAYGQQAIPYLEHVLLECPPRSISVPRCRAVRVLGELGAYSALFAYFQRYIRPADAAVLFAEDAVRSAAARELMQCKSDAVFRALLAATRQRATSGLVQAIGEFRSPESVPLLFELLEDDLCREDAKEGLRKVPDAARTYAILLLRGCTDQAIDGPAASRRRRATLQLMSEFGIAANEWPELRAFLWDEDPDCVIAVAQLGLCVAPEAEKVTISAALIEASAKVNGAQEIEVVELLKTCSDAAQSAAMKIDLHRRNNGEKPNWLSPFWRTLYCVLGRDFEKHPHGAA